METMKDSNAFSDLEKFFGKADKAAKDEQKEKVKKKKGPQVVNLLGE